MPLADTKLRDLLRDDEQRSRFDAFNASAPAQDEIAEFIFAGSVANAASLTAQVRRSAITDGTAYLIRASSELFDAVPSPWQVALFDPLTELPNRELLRDRMHQAIHAVSRLENAYLGVLFIDLDRFKKINDNFGHAAGDAVLVEVAKRLRSCVRESDTVARLGGEG